MYVRDTIAAIATPPGYGSIGVIRVSGEDLESFIAQLTHQCIRTRSMSCARFLGESGDVIDSGLLLSFPSPHSYTGEHVVEIQAHGGGAIMQMLLERCFQLGARPAHPGEFTMRAVLNNKIDMLQAEAIDDMIKARHRAASQSAARMLQGEFSMKIEALIEKLVRLRAYTEGLLDFAEDSETYDITQQEIAEQLRDCTAEINEIAAQYRQKNRLMRIFNVVFTGSVNVGKSSLYNRLLANDAAITSDIPGTTRDVLREETTVGSYQVRLHDTAGLNDSPTSPIEEIGITRTVDALTEADIVIFIVDITSPPDAAQTTRDQERIPPGLPVIYAANKVDCLKHTDNDVDGGFLNISAKTGQNIDKLRDAIVEAIEGKDIEGKDSLRTRQMTHLTAAMTELNTAGAHQAQLELLAEHLAQAHEHLARLIRHDSYTDRHDAVLSDIFASFCIGK